jgi:iron complex outermembrane receptor protein
LRVGEKGSLNITLGYANQDKTNRAGSPGKDELFGVDNEWTRANPELGMVIGLPKMETTNLFVNFEQPTGENGKFYTFGGVTYRKATSYALYRTPYWITSDYGLLTPSGETYNGFLPNFTSKVLDNGLTSGWKSKVGNWNFDVSATYGANSVDYEISNTINTSIGATSPTNFDAGGHQFSNIIGNLDLARQLGNLHVGFGAEARSENFKAIAGEPSSYFGSGAQSFPGLQPQNEVNKNRQNIGAYVDAEWDVTKDFLIGGALRFENYSDFGNNVSWKLDSRYKLLDEKLIFRASVSTGFRAPSLAQIYYSNIQTKVTSGTVANQGTFNNESTIVITDLGVAKLNAEKAYNFTAGFTTKPINKLTITADYYRIKIDNRILFSGDIGYKTGEPGNPDTSNPVEVILNANSISSLKFFTNAVNTLTSGFDLVANYNLPLNHGKLSFLAAYNYNNTKIVGNIAVPSILENNGYSINFFDRKEQSRIVYSRPKDKFILGTSYDFSKFDIHLNNTYFGSVTWDHATDPSKDQTFKGKVITDLVLGYKITNDFKVTAVANNLLNIYPDKIDTKGDVSTDLGGRFKYPWEVNQFGFSGTVFSLNLNYTF